MSSEVVVNGLHRSQRMVMTSKRKVCSPGLEQLPSFLGKMRRIDASSTSSLPLRAGLDGATQMSITQGFADCLVTPHSRGTKP